MKRRKTAMLPRISAEQARQALHVLVAEGRIAAREVANALARREKLVRELRSRLTALGEDAVGAMDRAARGAGVSLSTRRAVRRRARVAITAAQKSARQAQGRYLGAIRRLSKASRARIREIRKRQGVQAAIAAAKKLAG